MKRTLLLIYVISSFLTICAQKRIQFTYKDETGCVFVFKTETANGQNVALVSASNKKNARMEIPADVSNKGTIYVVTRIESEALKGCDDGIRELIFPNTVETIGGMLFGSVIKLSGGFGGLMKGGTGGPLSKIRLDKLVIPQSVYAIGGNAFLTGYTKEGVKGLSSKIIEIPSIIMPWSAKDFGLVKKDVTDYWRAKDPTKLSPILAAEAKQKKLRELYEKTPPYSRQDMLKYFLSDDEPNKEAAKTALDQVSDYGITKDEYIAALQGYYNINAESGIPYDMYANFKESIEQGNISLSSYLELVIDLDNQEQTALLQKFEQYEAKGNYAGALKVATKIMGYTSDPLLSFVSGVCQYKTDSYKKSMESCLSAINDGRLIDDEMNVAGMMAAIAAEKYAEKLMQKVEKIERLLGVAEKALDESLNATINNMGQQNTLQQGQVMTMPQSAYNGSSDYYTSPAYLAQVQARADQFMINAQQQYQQIGQYYMNNLQQQMERSKKMFADMADWSLRFINKNGREPTDLEKYQWVQQNYPDMYASYLQAQAAIYEKSLGDKGSNSEDSAREKPISNTYDCSYCNGGRLLQEDEVLSFGLPVEKEYKCKECGKWKIKGMTHRHYDCPHCKGSGKVTFN